jgi:hypothetical protein
MQFWICVAFGSLSSALPRKSFASRKAVVLYVIVNAINDVLRACGVQAIPAFGDEIHRACIFEVVPGFPALHAFFVFVELYT